MARQIGRLSSAQVRHAKAGMHADGGGLYLQVTAGKDGQLNKSWLFRFQMAARERQMGLGSFNTVGLSEARDEAERCRKLLRDGKDPIEARKTDRAAKQEAAVKSAMTFERCATAYMAAHEAGWRNAKHRQQWHNTLSTYAYPIIGKLSVQDVDTGLVMQIVQPIWANKNETASRIRGRIETILDWAKVQGRRSGENPARWAGHLEHLLPARNKVHKEQHYPALPWEQIPEFMSELRQQEGLAARCLEFTVLTAARSGESRGMPWDGEINTATQVWNVPASRMKREREHRVPLAAPALAIIEYMREVRQNDYVFPGDKPDDPLSDMALTEVIRRMNQARKKAGLPQWVDPKQGNREVVPHGFRSTFDDWVAEATDYPDWLADAALAHAKGDKVEAAYKRGDALAKRRKMMEAWATYCGDPAAKETAENVVSMAAE